MKGEIDNNNFSSIYPLIHCALAYIQCLPDWSAEIKCTVHIALPKQLINQFSKELTVLVYKYVYTRPVNLHPLFLKIGHPAF